MATPRVTIPELPAQAAVVDTDLLVVQNGATTKKMTLATLTSPASTALAAHLANPTDAHDASAVSATANTAPLTGTNVQLQLAQAGTEIAAVKTTANTATTNLAAHLADTIDAHDATAVSFVPASGIAAVEVQAAIVELATDAIADRTNITTNTSGLAAHIADTDDAHDAIAISVTPIGGRPGTNVQALLADLADDPQVPGVFTTSINGLVPAPGAATGKMLTDGGTWGTLPAQPLFTSTTDGTVPASGGGAVNYLRADGSWNPPAGGGGGITTEDAVDATAAAFAAGTHSNITVTYNDAANSISLAGSAGGGGVSDGDKGDIVVSASGATWMFDTGVVTAAAKTVLDDASTTAMRTTLGLGSVDNTADTAKPISTATQTALDTKVDKPAIVVQSGTAVTAALTDAGDYLRFTGTNPTFTVPPNSSVAFPIPTTITGIGTATAMTLVQGSGVTITKARTLVTLGAGSGWTLVKTGTDAWDVHGDFV